ncbi:MAG TPA: hypothetical protein VFE58_11955 [Tepidisphaeraceae bacterium]|nr:hypothetical protein [Tepidisphaeraceae bacterium]
MASAAVEHRRKVAINVTLALAIMVGLGAASAQFKKYIDKRAMAANPEPPHVVLKNRPAWMSDFLADSITAPVRPDIAKSPFDHQVLVDAVAALKQNPWIREIHDVRRTYTNSPGDTIEVDCEYRAPIALVKWNDHYTLIDNQGTVLPEQFSESEIPRIAYGADGKMNIRVIDGVAHKPASPGDRWPGADLAAGIELVQLLYGQPYAEDILKVNVANFQGRHSPRDPQLTLVTRFNPATELRWGRPVTSKDGFIEVSPAQKLNYLSSVYNKYHRVDAGQPWLDLRFDHILYPAPETDSAAQASAVK